MSTYRATLNNFQTFEISATVFEKILAKCQIMTQTIQNLLKRREIKKLFFGLNI